MRNLIPSSHLQVGGNRCSLSYRRCETSVPEMLKMINIELEEIENIQKEVDNGVISIADIENRRVFPD